MKCRVGKIVNKNAVICMVMEGTRLTESILKYIEKSLCCGPGTYVVLQVNSTSKTKVRAQICWYQGWGGGAGRKRGLD